MHTSVLHKHSILQVKTRQGVLSKMWVLGVLRMLQENRRTTQTQPPSLPSPQ